MLKQLKRRNNNARAFGVVLNHLVFIHLERISPDLDLGLTARGIPCILGNRLADFFVP